jgi:hypothetical protein
VGYAKFHSYGVIEITVAVKFKVIYLKMYQNNFFLKLFLTSTHQNDIKIFKKVF